MKSFKHFIFIIFFCFFFSGTTAYAEENKNVLLLNPNFTTEFLSKFYEGLTTALAEYNINFSYYVVNNPDDESEIKNIKSIAEKNKSLSIISLDKISNNLLEQYSIGYLDEFKIHLLDIDKNNYELPPNFKIHHLYFDLEKNLNIITDLHKVSSVNFIVDKYFLDTKFYSDIQNYISKREDLNFNIVFSDDWSKVTPQLQVNNSLTVIFSCLYDESNGLRTKLTPFASVEKIAQFTDTPIYGGFAEFGTRYNIGAFNYNGLSKGSILANFILMDLGLIDSSLYLEYPKTPPADFIINENLNSYGIKSNNEFTIQTYSYNKNLPFAIEKKLNLFKCLIFLSIIFVVYLYFKNRIVKKLYCEQMKIDSLKTNFIANISHELRTPLNIIISTISLFDVYIKNGEVSFNSSNSLEKFNYLKKNSFRLLKLINNIIDTTRIDAGYFLLDKKTHNIVEVIEDVALSTVAYAERKNITLIFDTNYEEIYTLIDRDKIERIALNLLSNALKFTPSGGIINIFIDKSDTQTISISFKDTGVGISKENQKNIFDRFIQASDSLNKSEGSGIGLSLCKSIAIQHNGSISLNSASGIGSTFTLFLPIITEQITESKNLNKSRISELTEIEFSDH